MKINQKCYITTNMGPLSSHTSNQPAQPHRRLAHGLYYCHSTSATSTTTWECQICAKFTNFFTKFIYNLLFLVFSVLAFKNSHLVLHFPLPPISRSSTYKVAVEEDARLPPMRLAGLITCNWTKGAHMSSYNTFLVDFQFGKHEI